jgi:hypothetical protein
MMQQWDEEDRMTRALEDAPHVTVPADFAARVMARVPQRKATRYGLPLRQRTHYGRNLMVGGAVLLCALLVAVAVGGQTTAAVRVAEWTIFAQLAGIALWYGMARRTQAYR